MATTLPVVLDPASRDLHGQNAELRALGPVVPVELPGGVPAWAVTRHRELKDVLADPRFASDSRHWRALAAGEVPEGWPLRAFVTNPSMATVDGADHRRLRKLVAQAFTPRRVAELRPDIEHAVATLLDALERDWAGSAGPIDLRERFAWPLPLTVICDLLGFPEADRDELHRLSMQVASSTVTAEEGKAASGGLYRLLTGFVALRRREPRDDLTGGLIAAVTPDGERLGEHELVGTLTTLLVAGHGTVTNLLCNAVRALLANPAQLAELRTGRQPWANAVEEALRWDSPLGHFPMRYALEDVRVGDALIRKGDALLASYASAGRDEREYGEDAGRFDVARPSPRHLSFGHGVHFCVGAPLARLQAQLALPALFARFPRLALAVPPERLRAAPTIIGNGPAALPLVADGQSPG